MHILLRLCIISILLGIGISEVVLWFDKRRKRPPEAIPKERTKTLERKPPEEPLFEVSGGYQVCVLCFMPLEEGEWIPYGQSPVCRDRAGCRYRRRTLPILNGNPPGNEPIDIEAASNDKGQNEQ